MSEKIVKEIDAIRQSVKTETVRNLMLLDRCQREPKASALHKKEFQSLVENWRAIAARMVGVQHNDATVRNAIQRLQSEIERCSDLSEVQVASTWEPEGKLSEDSFSVDEAKEADTWTLTIDQYRVLQRYPHLQTKPVVVRTL